MDAVVPFVRSTKQKYLPIHAPEMESPNHVWTGPVAKPNGESATAYIDEAGAVGGDAPDYLFRYQGLSDTGVKPPDIACAVAQNYIVQAVNAKWSICDKGGRMLFESGINEFVGDPQSLITNPRVVFDPWQQRFVQMWCARQPGSPLSFIILLISDDSNPTGNWNVYYFPATTGDIELCYPDDYDLGYGPTGVFASGNQYTHFGGFFRLSCLRSWNKAEIYSGSSALMRTDQVVNNPDASSVFAPRTAQLQATIIGTEALFINSRPGGGDKLTLWKITDPFGAHNLVAVDINVAFYDMPVVGIEPSGALVDTQDCRLMNCVVGPSSTGGLLLFTGSQESHLWSGDTALRAVAHFYVLDPVTDAVTWEALFGLPQYSYWCPSATVDFRQSAMWAFARCGQNLPAFGAARYVDWNQGVFSNNSKQLKDGEGNYNGFRWGDYLGATLDWNDYAGNGSKQKIWVAGEIAESATNVWATWLGTAVYGATPGALTVDQPDGFSVQGPPGGPFNATSVQFTLSNPGEVAYAYEVTGLPTWLDASNTYGEVQAGATRNITLSFNSVAFDLPIGNYSATLTFRNLYGGAVVHRLVSLRVQGFIFPSSVVVFKGFHFSGEVEEVRLSDDGYIMFFNDVSDLACKVAFIGVCSVTNAASMTITVESAVHRVGVSQSIQLYNYTTGRLVEFLGSIPGAGDTTRQIHLTAGIANYIAPTSRQMTVVLEWTPVNDEDPAQDGWIHKIDYLSWNVTP